MRTREEVQVEAVDAIRRFGHRGIIDVSPRVGKSKILLDSIKDKKDWKIVILAPYQSIVDSWIEEIKKWNCDLDIELYCTRSVSKVPKKGIDLIVIDEVQTLSNRQINTISNMSAQTRLLGLSGTLSQDTLDTLDSQLALVPTYSYSIDEAIKDGIISNFEIVLVECKLDNSRVNIKSGTKTKPRLVTENAHYNWLSSQYEKFRKLCFGDRSFEYLRDYYINQRRDFIYTAQSKLNVAKRIVQRGNRSLIFTGRVPQAEFLTKHSYHSKNKKDNNLTKFIEGDINELSVINMVNMGITIPDLKFSIIHQLQSNSEMSLQKILRMCNLEGDRSAKIYITYYKDTVDEKWVMNALQNVDKSRIRIIDEKKA